MVDAQVYDSFIVAWMGTLWYVSLTMSKSSKISPFDINKKYTRKVALNF